MSIFKCKMCGGTIEFRPGDSIGVCDSCGTKQTLPRLDSDRKANLYDRANHFRRNNEFDKAMGIYETILNEDPTDAEAYWSIVLCRYGIEYVEDPATHRRVPTVNRAQFTSIFDDEDYKSALKNADALQRLIYEDEAKVINEIQKGILEISAKEEPFDVFICYKETDANGRRTPDSVLATDLYHQLTNEGFKVFFSRITLEDKLGSAYEPYIFAALNSAKAMVVLGTKPEHFNAVWVKNEWSRYLALIKAGAKKTLIPAYRDMDPYDLPEEFSHLQAQDMSKLGFMQDLIRGIKKIIKTDEPKQATIRETVVQQATQTNTAPLLRRAFMFLEDGNWQSADEYCEKVLDIEPENAEAYLGKLMAELHVRTRDALKDQPEPFDNRNNYRKAFHFGDEKLKADLSSYTTLINARNEEKGEATKRRALAVAHALKEGLKTKDVPTLQHRLSASKTRIQSLTALRNGFDMLLAQKSQLLQEQATIFSQKTNLSAQLSTLTFQEASLVAQRAKLGIFAGKEKKRIDEELARIAVKKREFSISINELDAKEHELTERIERNRQQRCNFNTKKDIDQAIDEESAEVSKIEAQIESDHVNAGKEYSYEEALNIYLRTPDVTRAVNASLYQTASQDSIMFGNYVQKKNGSPEPIEWEVLARENGRILVISKYALDCQKYNTMENNVSWETCSLRKWLNGAFLNAAFNAVEQKLILETMATANKDSSFSTSSGNNTKDKVFLLSEMEVKKYFNSNETLQCAPTDYAVANSTDSGAYGGWWLRSTRGASINADCILGGLIFKLPVDCHAFAVRPALWIDLTAGN